MGVVSEEDLQIYAGLGLEAITAILEDLQDGVLTAAAAEEHLLHALAQLIDELVPTGPFDDIDDSIIESALTDGFGLLRDVLHREPDELRAAAERKLEKVERARSSGRKRIGLAPVDKVEEKARELLLRADMIEAREAAGE